MKKIITLMTEFITDAVLVSAYDEHYGHLNSKQLTFPSVIFLDSGGYEARVEHDLSESYGQAYKPEKWSKREHQSVLKNWKSNRPTVAVNFDSPARHTNIERQLQAALTLQNDYPHFAHEFLIKPERKRAELDIRATLPKVASRLSSFAAVGFTEHELDSKIIDRMRKIAEARRVLDDAGVKAPIHIFGSLDSFSTALYFLSGAEIFDGLTWLRFGFFNGQTLYKYNYGAMNTANGLLRSAEDLSHLMWKDNYYYLESLRDQMRNYLMTKEFSSFKHIGQELEAATQQLEARVLQGGR